MSRPWVRFPPLAPESRNNLDAEGGKPSAPSCFGFFYAQKSHSGAMDVSGVCQATGGIRTPIFRVIHRFSHTAPFFPGEKGRPESQIFCTKFRCRFYGRCTSPKTGAFFRFIGKGGSSWNKTPVSRSSLAACGGRGLNHPYGRCSARGLNKNRISDPEPSRQVETEGEGTGESIRGTAAAPFWGDAAFPVPQAAPEGR